MLTILTVQQGLKWTGQNMKKEINPKFGMKNLAGNFGFQYSNLFCGLPLETEGGSFSPRLSIATVVVASKLQMQHQCPADPQTYPAY